VTGEAVRSGTVEGAGVSLAYIEQGEGDPVVLVHGTGVGHALWEEVLAALGGRRRAIAYDRRAYGSSDAPDPYRGSTVAEQAEDAAALIAGLEAAPAVVCGHELGALVALDLLWRHAELVAGAVLVEPPVLALSIEGPAVVSSLREAIEEGAREADDPATGAADAYLGATAGEAAFDLLGLERTEAARASGRALAADLVAAPTYAFGRRDLRTLDAPVAVLAGTRSGRVRRAVARELAGLLPEATLHEPEAGHLVPIEAPDAVADAIADVALRRARRG
jgi:pimeloyl-ACP methyl ester carboxylesterase